MAGRKSDFTLTKLDDLFTTQAQRDEEQLSKIRDIPLELIDDFPDHPFKVRDDEDMMQLVESVKERGVITPATVRQKEDGRYELVSGHRRKRACELAGFETLRSEIVDLNRDEATILMVESNFQRSEILPSEKAFAYYDPNPNRSKQSDYLTMKEKAGMPTRYSVAKEAIDYAIDHSKTLKEFQFALKEMGYAYNLSPSRKYWTVIPKGYDKPIRLKNLGADYTNDRIVERIKENRDRWAEIEPFQRATYKPRQYRMQTRGQKLKKKGGLYGLYLYYCYRLGYLPKYKKQNNARLHYLLKDDLMKLDKITDEVRLLGRENISTDEQLFSYKTSLEEQMKNLIAGRTHLRKKIRTNIDDGQLQAAKDEIASINGELKKLRREVKLCEDIAERSKVMEENLEHIETEEQKQQRKEKSRYEQRW